MNTKQRKR